MLENFPEIKKELEFASKLCATLRAENESLKWKMSEMKNNYEENFTRQLNEINELSKKLGRRRSMQSRGDLQNELGDINESGIASLAESKQDDLMKRVYQEGSINGGPIPQAKHSSSFEESRDERHLRAALLKKRSEEKRVEKKWCCCFPMFGARG
mmetsp:Transcript_26638/g.64542  ORF Transcript_26638/g.64542 Transcript_26638/m.64542 type:complete len:156 (+) Transcript_26638:745-1212(+)